MPNANLNSVRILQVMTDAWSIEVLLTGQLRYLTECGYQITAAGAGRDRLAKVRQSEGVATEEIVMSREIAPLQDLTSLFRLWRLTRRIRPQVTNVATPKAGLLGGLAAWISGVPCRVYTLHGLRFETSHGFRRWLLILAERIACRCAHTVVCVSPSLRQRAIDLRLCEPDQAVVFGKGSCNGLECARFERNEKTAGEAAALRKRLDIGSDVPVLGFVGRLTRDKGIEELVKTFLLLRLKFLELRLLLVGDFEAGDPVDPEIREIIQRHPAIIRTGFAEDTAPYYHVLDILALPSYREGLGTVLLEAAAAGKPCVATEVTGIVDAVVDGVTGLLVKPRDTRGLEQALAQLLDDPSLCTRLGLAARDRVRQEYDRQRIWREWSRLYRTMIQAHGGEAAQLVNENVA